MCQVVPVDESQSVPANSVIVGSCMLDNVPDSDVDCITSVTPLMDLVNIVKVITLWIMQFSIV